MSQLSLDTAHSLGSSSGHTLYRSDASRYLLTLVPSSAGKHALLHRQLDDIQIWASPFQRLMEASIPLKRHSFGSYSLTSCLLDTLKQQEILYYG